MVNSTWTRHHIMKMWNYSAENVTLVYPPCGTFDNHNNNNNNNNNNSSNSNNSNNSNKQYMILSIGQFRPEKDHMLQLDSLNQFLSRLDKSSSSSSSNSSSRKNNRKRTDQEFGNIHRNNVKLVMMGSTRGKMDEKLVQQLHDYSSKMNLDANVDILVNRPYSELQSYMSIADIGLHTMWNEHFGISVVEMMAAGMITIAHNSGGPQLDIVIPSKKGVKTGKFLVLACSIVLQVNLDII
jgi:alpha-1,2-mannosyltransferase